MRSGPKTAAEIIQMKKGGKILATVLAETKSFVRPGLSTKEVADRAAEVLLSLGGESAFLGFEGFPDVICISINDEVVHGIPKDTKFIEEGDIIGLDFGVNQGGLITDGAITFIVGKPRTPKDKLLLEITETALYAGLDAVRAGARVGDISSAIESTIDQKKFGIIRDLVGHGVGYGLHEDPNIPNYGRAGTGMVLQEGMTIAVEPMITTGSHSIFIDSDGWTIRTKDRSNAAQFEHTVLVTKDGYEILTQV